MINQETKTLSIRGQHAPDSAAFCLKQGSTYSGSSPQRGQHLPDWHANTSCNRSCTSEIPALLKGSAWSGLSSQQGYKVVYYNTQKLFARLKMAGGDGAYYKEVGKIEKQDLLILDDFALT